MLNENQLRRLNDQVAEEAFVSRFYLSVSCWAQSRAYAGTSAFFRAHHELEENHMHKLMDYILETGGKVDVRKLDMPDQEFESIASVLKISLSKEIENSTTINKMVEQFWTEKDLSTFNFLQWFVSEQHEEEHLFRSLIDKVELIGEEGRGYFWIDKELGRMAAEVSN